MCAQLILPNLPENLQRLRKEEDSIRAQSLLHIDEDAALKDHLDLVHDSLDVIFAFTKDHVNTSDDELVMQRLGIRLFNSGACALSLLLTGYYQNSVLQMRDLLETGFLVDYFRTDPSQISAWQGADDRERKRRFGPVVIRDALDKRDGLEGKKREEAYRLLSNYAAHPTHAGFKLFSPKWMSKIGPFFDETYLKALLQELTKRLPASAEAYVRSFHRLAPEIENARRQFLHRLNKWIGMHMGNGVPQ